MGTPRSPGRPAGPASRPRRVLQRKAAPDGDRCLLIDDGRPCPRPSKTRGVCDKHYTYLRVSRQLGNFALPPQPSEAKRHRVELKADPVLGVCRLVVNGRPCELPTDRRGLCRKHYASLWQRPDVNLDDFALPAGYKPPIRLRRSPVEGECRVHQGGADCRERAHARGLCQKHYKQLRDPQPALFRQIATPDPNAREFALRRTLRDGRCRVATNGQGCGQPSETRGLCRHHYSVLRGRPELERIALPARQAAARVYTRAPDAAQGVDRCVVVENGVRCSGVPERRGVCREHHKRIGNSHEYSLGDFYLPERPPTLERKPAEECRDGLCVVLEDGAGCQTPPHVRGLCRRHYRVAMERGVLEALASAARDARSPFGAGNDRPHFYLDKNVLFDHADHRVFRAEGQDASVRLVERVVAGAVRASVSADAVKSSYNHVRYRLERPAAEGGRDLDPAEADRIARQHVAATFFGRGAWRIVALDAPVFRRVASAPPGDLSLEDALELQAYQQARAGKAGPTLFVTRDTDFVEGVHPNDLVREWGW